jgi:hypothetical protein
MGRNADLISKWPGAVSAIDRIAQSTFEGTLYFERQRGVNPLGEDKKAMEVIVGRIPLPLGRAPPIRVEAATGLTLVAPAGPRATYLDPRHHIEENFPRLNPRLNKILVWGGNRGGQIRNAVSAS